MQKDSKNSLRDNEYLEAVNNGDIIKGTFCGHKHTWYYTEILAKTASGEATVIPQVVIAGTPYDGGHALKIIVK